MAEQSTGDANTPSRFDPYGPNALADETRQAQMTNANDTPTDVNVNAVVGRVQTAAFVGQQETLTLMGKNFEADATRRNKQFDDLAMWRSGGLKNTP
jgi:hypothetical protein